MNTNSTSHPGILLIGVGNEYRRDDGVGLPGDFDLDKVSTLGLRLVKILTSQLGGELTFRRNGGTEFEITFKAQRERERR